MALFTKKDKNKEVTSCCDEKENTEKTKSIKSEESSIKILGSGCKKCNQLEAATKGALAQLKMEATIDHVTDFQLIAAYGVMRTPALVVDGKVVSYGKVLTVEEIVKLIEKARK